MLDQVLDATIAVIIGVSSCLLYFWGTNLLLEALVRDKQTANGQIESRDELRHAIRPWLFVLPALSLLFTYLVYPVFETVWLSFHDFTGERWVGWSSNIRLGPRRD